MGLSPVYTAQPSRLSRLRCLRWGTTPATDSSEPAIRVFGQCIDVAKATTGERVERAWGNAIREGKRKDWVELFKLWDVHGAGVVDVFALWGNEA